VNAAHFTYVLRLADNALILGQRLSEWCGHSPFLEEDIAMANTALDHVGRARMLFTHAAQLEGLGRDEDDLAYRRDEREFGNFLICELPIGDYAFTLLRQYFVDVYHLQLYCALSTSADGTLAAIAAKTVKESTYHVRRSRAWVARLGDGTPESRQRMQAALRRDLRVRCWRLLVRLHPLWRVLARIGQDQRDLGQHRLLRRG